MAVDKLTSGIETDEQHIQAEIKSAEVELSKVENSSNAQSQVAKRVIELHKTKAQEKKNEVKVKKPSSVKSSGIPKDVSPLVQVSDAPAGEPSTDRYIRTS